MKDIRGMPSRRLPAATAPREISPAQLEEWALAYLARYASPAEGLRRVLRRRVRRRLGDDRDGVREADASIEELVARYRAAGLLVEDELYAAARARRDIGRGRSLRRIAVGLAAKGIGAQATADALEALRTGPGDPELAAACAFARRRRLGPFRIRPAERARELAAFGRAGFGRAAAAAVLDCADEAEIAALLAAAQESD